MLFSPGARIRKGRLIRKDKPTRRSSFLAAAQIREKAHVNGQDAGFQCYWVVASAFCVVLLACESPRNHFSSCFLAAVDGYDAPLTRCTVSYLDP